MLKKILIIFITILLSIIMIYNIVVADEDYAEKAKYFFEDIKTEAFFSDDYKNDLGKIFYVSGATQTNNGACLGNDNAAGTDDSSKLSYILDAENGEIKITSESGEKIITNDGDIKRFYAVFYMINKIQNDSKYDYYTEGAYTGRAKSDLAYYMHLLNEYFPLGNFTTTSGDPNKDDFREEANRYAQNAYNAIKTYNETGSFINLGSGYGTHKESDNGNIYIYLGKGGITNYGDTSISTSISNGFSLVGFASEIGGKVDRTYRSGLEYVVVKQTDPSIDNVTVSFNSLFTFYGGRMLLITSVSQQNEGYFKTRPDKKDGEKQIEITLDSGDGDFELYVQKQYNGNNVAISGVKFEVSKLGGDIIGTIETNNEGNGKLYVPLTEKGTYIIKEIDFPDSQYGYIGNFNDQVSFVINSVDSVTGDDVEYTKEDNKSGKITVYFSNDKYLDNLLIKKVEKDKNEMVIQKIESSIYYKLNLYAKYEDSIIRIKKVYIENNKLKMEYVNAKDSTKSGTITFDNIPDVSIDNTEIVSDVVNSTKVTTITKQDSELKFTAVERTDASTTFYAGENENEKNFVEQLKNSYNNNYNNESYNNNYNNEFYIEEKEVVIPNTEIVVHRIKQGIDYKLNLYAKYEDSIVRIEKVYIENNKLKMEYVNAKDSTKSGTITFDNISNVSVYINNTETASSVVDSTRVTTITKQDSELKFTVVQDKEVGTKFYTDNNGEISIKDLEVFYKDKEVRIGKEANDVLIGDVNGDGEVTSKDVVSLNRYINKSDNSSTFIEDISDNSSTFIEAAADVDNNGIIELFDLQLLSVYVAEWNLTTVSVAYGYYVEETSPAYGYSMLENGKSEVKTMAIYENEKVTTLKANRIETIEFVLENERKLGDLQVEKATSNSTNEILPKVSMRIARRNGSDSTTDGNIVLKIRVGTELYNVNKVEIIDNKMKLTYNSSQSTLILTNVSSMDITIETKSTSYKDYTEMKSESNKACFGIATTGLTAGTIFITDSDGQINIYNLETDYDENTKYQFYATEITNSNYGYGYINNGDNVKSDPKELTINGTIQIQMTNEKKLGNLKLKKVNENNTDIALSGVEMRLQRNNPPYNTDKYSSFQLIFNLDGTTYRVDKIYTDGGNLKIDYGNLSTEKTTGTITFSEISSTTANIVGRSDTDGNVISGEIPEYSIENSETAKTEAKFAIAYGGYYTKFYTDSNGQISVDNLETNYDIDTVYKFRVIEENNPNYGYGCITTDNTVTLDIDELTTNDANPIEITNTSELGNLQVIKADENNIALSGVEMRLQRNNPPYNTDKYSSFQLIFNLDGTIYRVDKIYTDGGNLKIDYGNLSTEKTTGTITFSEISSTTANIVGRSDTDGNVISGEIPECINSETAKTANFAIAYGGNYTKFYTDSNGQISVYNLETNYNEKTKYKFRAVEENNPNYGYGYINNGDKVKSDPKELTINDIKQIEMTNEKKLGNLQVIKADENDESIKLSGVEMRLQRNNPPYNTDKYSSFQLIFNLDGTTYRVDKIYTDGGNLKIDYGNLSTEKTTGTITFSEISSTTANIVGRSDTDGNVISGEIPEYKNSETAETEANFAIAYGGYYTKFYTDSNGQISVDNLETNYDIDTVYKFRVIEENNPNYGYRYITNGKTVTLDIDKLSNDGSKTMKNKQVLGDLKIEKVDEYDENIKLSGVDFKIQQGEKYIKLVDIENNNEVKVDYISNAIISKTGKAYHETNGNDVIHYLGIVLVNDKNQATTFRTDNDGTIEINNLEVYKDSNNNKISYKIYEINTNNSNYEIIDETVNAELEPNTETEKIIENRLIAIDISGYVWEDLRLNGKATEEFNNLYKDDESDANDVRVPNIYVVVKDKNGNIITNAEENQAVAVTDDEGNYIIEHVPLDQLDGAYVEFVYDGYTYTSVELNVGKANGSKAQENSTERTNLNNNYKEITNETHNQIQDYINQSYANTNSLGKYQRITAKTDDDQIKLERPENGGTKIENINLGLVKRSQIDLAISSYTDIEKVEVELNGSTHTYKYGLRGEVDEGNLNVDIDGESSSNPAEYIRELYESDVSYSKEQQVDNKMNVYVTYKIIVQNSTNDLKAKVIDIVSYIDKNYTVVDSYLNTEEYKIEWDDVDKYTNDVYKKIHSNKFNAMLNQAGRENSTAVVYLKVQVSDSLVEELLENAEGRTLDCISEIASYETYYSEDTKEAGVTGNRDGQIYASLDKDSTPENATPGNSGTYEDDTKRAPTLRLRVKNPRELSGTVWEDKDSDATDGHRLGNGILDTDENRVENVKVELIDVQTEEVATLYSKQYENGTQSAVTYTDASGNYTFTGVAAGKEYITRFTYGTFETGNGQITTSINGETIDVRDYKSTIITSSVIEYALEHRNENWYINAENTTRYSDAIDNLELREDSESETIYNGNYNYTYNVEANTAEFKVNIEFLIATETQVNENGENQEGDPFLTIQGNMDFGIIERPIIDLKVNKEISYIKISLQSGQVLIEGDPRTQNLPNTKRLDILVATEIETELLQGATLEATYTITVTNNSEIDYDYRVDDEYYYYGRTNRNPKPLDISVTKLVDYLENEVDCVVDTEENNTDWSITNAEKLITGEKVYINDEVYNKVYINENVYNDVKEGYIILETDKLSNIAIGESKSVELKISKALAETTDISVMNHTEILEITGGRKIKSSIPGNYEPKNLEPDELDDDRVLLTITPPTGDVEEHNTNVVLISSIIGLVFVAVGLFGIVIIKKFVIKK